MLKWYRRQKITIRAALIGGAFAIVAAIITGVIELFIPLTGTPTPTALSENSSVVIGGDVSDSNIIQSEGGDVNVYIVATPIAELPFDHYGIYLQEGNSFEEMKVYNGEPQSGDTDGIPVTTNVKPVIVMWKPQVNLDLLILEGNQPEAYNVMPKGNDLLELQPASILKPGLYCFIQGNYLLPQSLIQHWCFRVSK